MDEMDLDLGDLSTAGAAPKAAAAASSRFAPKQKGKAIKLSVPKPEPVEIKPAPPPIPAVKKSEPEVPPPIPAVKTSEPEPSVDPLPNGKDEHHADDAMKSDGEDEEYDDDENDERENKNEDEVVVQEIDVYFTAPPLAEDTSVSSTHCPFPFCCWFDTRRAIFDFSVVMVLQYTYYSFFFNGN